MPPKWNPQRLTTHHKKRTTKDKGCFEQLLGLKKTMTEREYEDRSETAVKNAWFQYECEARNVDLREYYPTRMYFVDEQLVVAITDTFEKCFFTCYHEHFSRPHNNGASSLGQLKLKYLEHLKFEEQAKLVRKVRRHRCV